MLKAVVEWQWGEPERQAWDFGLLVWLESFEPGSGWERNVSGNNHLRGDTRMAANPGQGVVDAQLRVHALDNLRLSSCSVFLVCLVLFFRFP